MADTLNIHGDYRILTISCYHLSDIISLCLRTVLNALTLLSGKVAMLIVLRQLRIMKYC